MTLDANVLPTTLDEPREMTLNEEMLNDFLETLEGSSFTFFVDMNKFDEFVSVTIYDGGCQIARVYSAEEMCDGTLSDAT